MQEWASEISHNKRASPGAWMEQDFAWLIENDEWGTTAIKAFAAQCASGRKTLCSQWILSMEKPEQ